MSEFPGRTGQRRRGHAWTGFDGWTSDVDGKESRDMFKSAGDYQARHCAVALSSDLPRVGQT